MKTLKGMLVAAALCLFLFTPAEAQDEPVWGHGTNAVIFSLNWESREDAPTVFDTSGQWLHYTSDAHAFGVALSVLDAGGASAAGVGPAYEFNFPALKNGHFFVLSRVELLTGSAADIATGTGIVGVGYKLHIGDSSAVRLTLDYSDALDMDDDAPAAGAALMEQSITFGVAIEIGMNKNTSVQ